MLPPFHIVIYSLLLRGMAYATPFSFTGCRRIFWRYDLLRGGHIIHLLHFRGFLGHSGASDACSMIFDNCDACAGLCLFVLGERT